EVYTEKQSDKSDGVTVLPEALRLGSIKKLVQVREAKYKKHSINTSLAFSVYCSTTFPRVQVSSKFSSGSPNLTNRSPSNFLLGEVSMKQYTSKNLKRR
ncbi:MAG: hypothetical protein AAF551_15315, partial [Bacteroidota bacterium]